MILSLLHSTLMIYHPAKRQLRSRQTNSETFFLESFYPKPHGVRISISQFDR